MTGIGKDKRVEKVIGKKCTPKTHKMGLPKERGENNMDERLRSSSDFPWDPAEQSPEN